MDNTAALPSQVIDSKGKFLNYCSESIRESPTHPNPLYQNGTVGYLRKIEHGNHPGVSLDFHFVEVIWSLPGSAGSSTLFAGAIHAAMLGTGRARAQKLFAHGRTRSMHANRCIGRGDVLLPGKILYALFFQIDRANRLRVLRFQPLKNPLEAAAYLVLE